MDSDDLAELQNRRLQHAAAVRAAEEAKEDLVQKVCAEPHRRPALISRHIEPPPDSPCATPLWLGWLLRVGALCTARRRVLAGLC